MSNKKEKLILWGFYRGLTHNLYREWLFIINVCARMSDNYHKPYVL